MNRAVTTRETFTIAAVAFLCGAAVAAPPVTFESSYECRDAHGKARLSAKNDASLPPTDTNAIQSVTPSQMFKTATVRDSQHGF
jgi:hypothetical protein